MTKHGVLATAVRIATTNTTLQTVVKQTGALKFMNWLLGVVGIMRSVPGTSLRYRLRYLDTAVLARGIFTDGEYRMLAPDIDSIETVIDLGCNVGLFPLYLCAIGRRRDFRGVLVDGNPQMVAEAKTNLGMNGLLEKFQVVHGIAGGPPGTTQDFCITQNTMSSTMHGEILGSQIGVKRISVPVVDVWAIFREACPGDRKCDLLKVDIEGCELDFLRSNPELLAMTQSVVVEFHKHACSYADIHDLLCAAGFVAAEVVDDADMPWGVAYFRKSRYNSTAER
jgi:FkbM family methyltransferase